MNIVLFVKFSLHYYLRGIESTVVG